jgi:hypothetical protein
VADRRIAFGALIGAALLAGCHSGDTGNAVSPAPQPTPTAVSTAAAPTVKGALDSYLGHYPFDAVGGVRFLDQPAVAKAVAALVPDTKVRALVLGGEGPGTPVARKDGKLLAWGCETHNCGGHDWSILIAPDGGEASVCYHDAATMRERARWYLAPGRSEMRDGDCPSE